MEINNEIMEIVSFEKRTFEEIAAKLDYFVQRMDDLCQQHGEKKAERWMDSHDVCRKLRISPRTLQTLRDNGTLAFTKIGNRTYYRLEDVERVIVDVEERRKKTMSGYVNSTRISTGFWLRSKSCSANADLPYMAMSC